MFTTVTSTNSTNSDAIAFPEILPAISSDAMMCPEIVPEDEDIAAAVETIPESRLIEMPCPEISVEVRPTLKAANTEKAAIVRRLIMGLLRLPSEQESFTASIPATITEFNPYVSQQSVVAAARIRSMSSGFRL